MAEILETCRLANTHAAQMKELSETVTELKKTVQEMGNENHQSENCWSQKSYPPLTGANKVPLGTPITV